MARISPFPFMNTGVPELKPYTFVNAVPAAVGTTCVGGITASTNLATSKGIVVGTKSALQGELLSIRSVKDVSETSLVRVGTVAVAKGDLLAADANGLAITTASGVVMALEAGAAGQIINVISAGAF